MKILLKILFSFSVIVFNMMKLLVKTFNYYNETICLNEQIQLQTPFLYSKFDVSYYSFEEFVLTIRSTRFFISKTST